MRMLINIILLHIIFQNCHLIKENLSKIESRINDIKAKLLTQNLNDCRKNMINKDNYTDYMEIFLEENSKVNLISKNDEKYLWEKHVFDSPFYW